MLLPRGVKLRQDRHGCEGAARTMIKIVIAGDTCPIGRNQPLFRKGDAQALLGDLLPEFEAADLAIANLECPLIEKEAPIAKCGPNLGAPIECVNGLKAMGIDVVGLANNHIMDHGPQGLRTTIQALDRHGIDHVGAGENLEQARKILIREVNGVRIGILAMAEHEFCIAGGKTPGANPLNIINSVRNIRDHRDVFDCLIVLLHGGNEYYPYPSPSLQQTSRFIVEEGANAVICQHSHCPGCYEHYQGGHIVYGQGNLLFDRHPQKQGAWNRGFVIRLSIKAGKMSQMDIVPYIQSDECPGARRMSADDEEAFRRGIQARSIRIQEEGCVEQEWRAFCMKKRHLYFSILRGHNRPMRVLNRIVRFTDWFYSRDGLRTLHNTVRCDAHREVLQSILSETQKYVERS